MGEHFQGEVWCVLYVTLNYIVACFQNKRKLTNRKFKYCKGPDTTQRNTSQYIFIGDFGLPAPGQQLST